MNRRDFLGTLAAGAMAQAQSSRVPIIDTHIHLFDQTRPQGVPYSGGGENKLPSLPPRYRKLARPLGIVGAIAVEASPWIEDNLWLLETMQGDTMMVGAVGDLQPEKPEFKEYLERYQKNKLFRGIRYGNIWGYDLIKQVSNPVFMEGIKLLAQAGLSLDTANAQPDLLSAAVRVSDKVPELRIVIDHLPNMMFRATDAQSRSAAEDSLRELAPRKQIYIKISEVMRVKDGAAVTDAAFYKPVLDHLFETFGADRVMFGSDWPNAAAVNNLPAIVRIAQDFIRGKGRAVEEKFFWKNSAAAYKWIPRDATQPHA